MSGLREYLKLKRQVVRRNRKAALTAENPVRTFSAVTTAEGRSGVRRTRIRHHQIITDSGPDNLGYDLGPSAPELVLAALGACMTHNFLINAALQGVPLDDIEVTVFGDYDFRAGQRGHADVPLHPYNIRYKVTVVTDRPEQDVAAVLAAVERECPLYNLFVTPVEVTGDLEVRAAVAG